MLTKLLRNATEAIRGSEKPTTVPGFLRPVDAEAIARQLRIEDLAAERGKQNIPPATTKSLDAVEQQIVQKIESEWAWQGGELINQLRAYTQRLIGYSVESEFSRLAVNANDTLARLRTADHRAEAELGPLREHFVACRDELARFRERHRLKRPARIPAHRWITFGLLILMISVEAMLNGLFFAKGNQFGILGGVGTAIGISMTNIVFSFLFGLWPARWMTHRNLIVKLAGFLVTICGVLAVLGLHAFAAHFRDATAAAGEDRAMAEALRTLMAAPWKLSDINSYYLFGMGVLFTIGSFYKGVSFDDPYPRYGAMFRRAARAREAYSDEHGELFDELSNIKDETVQRLDEGISHIPLYPQKAASIRAQRAALIETFRGYEATVQSAANHLLTKYRDKNRIARSNNPPSYFEAKWQLPHSFLDSAEVRTLMSDPHERERNMNEVLQELRALSEEVIAEYEKLMATYPHPTKME